ncbi:MAG: hypothetical protein E4H41_09445 [Gemmatimonadales bacterium]|nr:MAG: hypothetical protein E4H41_09445 [Gemmatimonadales bacterium]
MRIPAIARLIPIGTLLLSGACGTKPADAPDIALGPTADSIPTTLFEATAGAWLGGDRWAVLSPVNKRVVLLDFADGSATDLGQGMKRPFEGPFSLFAAGNGLYVADWALRRLTTWTLEGQYAEAIGTPEVTRGNLPRARDGQGNWYVQFNPPPGPDGSGKRDSAVVVRYSPFFSQGDTLFRLSPLDLAEVNGDAGRRFERRVFSGEDEWGVLADGSVWVARVYPNRVDWIGPDGKLKKGQRLPDRVFTITLSDREAFLRKFPPEMRSTAEKVPFSPVKPPFDEAFTGGDGMVWLEKSRVIPDTVRRYQVIGRDGRLVESISFNGYGYLLAASPEAVLVKEVRPEGMIFLRYRRPPS